MESGGGGGKAPNGFSDALFKAGIVGARMEAGSVGRAGCCPGRVGRLLLPMVGGARGKPGRDGREPPPGSDGAIAPGREGGGSLGFAGVCLTGEVDAEAP